MLRNYLQVAIRNMRRSRVYPLVNIIGLSIALAQDLNVGWVSAELEIST